MGIIIGSKSEYCDYLLKDKYDDFSSDDAKRDIAVLNSAFDSDAMAGNKPIYYKVTIDGLFEEKLRVLYDLYYSSGLISNKGNYNKLYLDYRVTPLSGICENMTNQLLLSPVSSDVSIDTFFNYFRNIEYSLKSDKLKTCVCQFNSLIGVFNLFSDEELEAEKEYFRKVARMIRLTPIYPYSVDCLGNVAQDLFDVMKLECLSDVKLFIPIVLNGDVEQFKLCKLDDSAEYVQLDDIDYTVESLCNEICKYSDKLYGCESIKLTAKVGTLNLEMYFYL